MADCAIAGDRWHRVWDSQRRYWVVVDKLGRQR